MSRRARRNHTPAFKAKVALAAVKVTGRCPDLLSSSTFTQSDHDVEGSA